MFVCLCVCVCEWVSVRVRVCVWTLNTLKKRWPYTPIFHVKHSHYHNLQGCKKHFGVISNGLEGFVRIEIQKKIMFLTIFPQKKNALRVCVRCVCVCVCVLCVCVCVKSTMRILCQNLRMHFLMGLEILFEPTLWKSSIFAVFWSRYDLVWRQSTVLSLRDTGIASLGSDFAWDCKMCCFNAFKSGKLPKSVPDHHIFLSICYFHRFCYFHFWDKNICYFHRFCRESSRTKNGYNFLCFFPPTFVIVILKLSNARVRKCEKLKLR